MPAAMGTIWGTGGGGLAGWIPDALACCFLVLIAVIDLRRRIVPNALICPAAGLALLVRALPLGRNTLMALVGGAVALLPFLLAALARPGSMGAGDVKLAGLIGLAAGYPQVLWPVSLGIIAGAVVSAILMVLGRREPGSQMPYAPCLCLGAAIALLYNPLSALGGS